MGGQTSGSDKRVKLQDWSLIEKVIIQRLARLAQKPSAISREKGSRNFLQLCQIVAELKLDQSAQPFFEQVLSRGSAGTMTLQMPEDREARFFGWAAVIQPEDGSWFNRWENLWEREKVGFWSVALSAMMNIRPDEAALRLPEVLKRREMMGIGSVAYLFHRILQKKVDWDIITGRWREEMGIDGRFIVGQIRTIFDDQYQGQIAEPAAVGLKKLDKANL